MITIPKSTYTQPNTSDLFGSVWYTRNINLNEAGYAQLSSRSVSILSEKDDNKVGIPMFFGRSGNIGGTQDIRVVTGGSANSPYLVTLSPTTLTVVEDEDTGAPNLSNDSCGRWFHGYWVVTDDSNFYTKSGSTWTDKGNLTSGKAHPIEVFRNKDLICFGDGNTVKAYSEAGGTFTLVYTLTIPSDFEIIGLAYSNYQLGVIANLSDATAGQNQEAYFFSWNGASAEASSGVPVGTDRIIGIVAYRGTFAVLTRAGELKGYTGGGWTSLAKFPFYFKSIPWGDSSTNRDSFGDVLFVDGDNILVNLNSNLSARGLRYETHLQNNPAGIWCYDPETGCSHKYSPSISPASIISASSGNINTTTDIITKSSGTIPSTCSPIKYINRTSLIGGLTSPRVYYVIKHNSTTFSLAETKEKAVNGVKIDLTSTGDTTNYFLALEEYDFGQTHIGNSGGIMSIGGINDIADGLIFGDELHDFGSTSKYDTMCMTVSGFENRGIIVSPRLSSSQVEDILQRLFINYKPLEVSDKIIVKIKSTDVIGLPVSTPQARSSSINQCSWLGKDTLSTTADLEAAKTAFDAGVELEGEIIAGAGAGVMAQIESISYENGTYSVVFDEDIVGAASGRYCDIIIDNWRKVGEITSNDNNNYKEMLIGDSSSWHMIKIELRGYETTIRSNIIINDTYRKSA